MIPTFLEFKISQNVVEYKRDKTKSHTKNTNTASCYDNHHEREKENVIRKYNREEGVSLDWKVHGEVL